MQLKLPHPAWVAFILLALTGCHQGVDLFRVESGPRPDASTGSPDQVSISLREKPAQQETAEGYLLTESRSTPLYTLREEYQAAPGGESWAFTLTGMDRPLTIVVYGDDGRVGATRSLAAPALDTTDAVIVVSIPGSMYVRSFQIVDDSSGTPGAGGDERLRLVGVSTGPPSGASPVGMTQSDSFLVIGHGSEATAWRHEENGSVTWSVSPHPDRWSPLAPVEIAYRYEPISPGTADDPILVRSVDLKVGTEDLQLKVRAGANRVVVYPEIYGVRATDVTVRSAVDGFKVLSIVPIHIAPTGAGDDAGRADTPMPLPADLGTVFEYPTELWRADRFELFRWTLFPEVLVMDTRNYEVQSRFFKRLAFFVEKEGFRGRILSDSELFGWHGYNAHNYNGAGLAAFFNAVQVAGVRLTDDEILLRRIVEQEGIILKKEGRFEPGVGGILSVSQESWRIPGLRHLLLTHEAYHGVYYADGEYVAQIGELWRSLSDDERRYWGLFLDGMQYDIADAYLVENEFQAYLLQQPADFAPWYFGTRSADRLRSWKPRETAWLNRFLIENDGAFLRQAMAVNEILYSRTGLVGGNVFCLESTIPHTTHQQ